MYLSLIARIRCAAARNPKSEVRNDVKLGY